MAKSRPPPLEEVVIVFAAGGLVLYGLARLAALVVRGYSEEKKRAACRREQYVVEARAARVEGLKREIHGKAVSWWSAGKAAGAGP
ncbi:hypothetical protein E2562_017680 [Oryza meyeriana var. granulata]|uniref:Uncharacterized protein n=1 Tax=Oryza meyeriana var. granulata TaxID=110450 RepID=A0A6G1BXS3_9ORYZ|nr:hypothetical protein E2562_017680 [Oryza meyeriana var. granulata]